MGLKVSKNLLFEDVQKVISSLLMQPKLSTIVKVKEREESIHNTYSHKKKKVLKCRFLITPTRRIYTAFEGVLHILTFGQNPKFVILQDNVKMSCQQIKRLKVHDALQMGHAQFLVEGGKTVPKRIGQFVHRYEHIAKKTVTLDRFE